MSVTPQEINDAISAHLSIGIDTDIRVEEARWERWLRRLSGDDLAIILHSCFDYIYSRGAIDYSDRWLLALLQCIEEAARNDSPALFHYLDSYRRDPYRSVLFPVLGHFSSEESITELQSWIAGEQLTEDEVVRLAQAYAASGTKSGLKGLDQLLASVLTLKPQTRESLTALRRDLSEWLASQPNSE
jgi:hypothetical protein